MSRGKTNYTKLRVLGATLEKWCEDNLIEHRKCSKYQWNIYIREMKVIIAVYPGSGIMWVPHAHYTGTGVIDKSSTKHSFHDEKSLIKKLQEIIFAADGI